MPTLAGAGMRLDPLGVVKKGPVTDSYPKAPRPRWQRRGRGRCGPDPVASRPVVQDCPTQSPDPLRRNLLVFKN